VLVNRAHALGEIATPMLAQNFDRPAESNAVPAALLTCFAYPNTADHGTAVQLIAAVL
jgi:hypothetical protein